MNNKLNKHNELFSEIKQIIETGKQQVSQTVNATLSATYWHIGKRINEEILGNKRADYGKRIVSTLGRQLTNEYGNGFSAKYLRKMMRFAEVFPDFQIVASLIRQLSWTHFTMIIYQKTDLERAFYAQMCRVKLLAKKLHTFTKTAKQLLENNLKGLGYE